MSPCPRWRQCQWRQAAVRALYGGREGMCESVGMGLGLASALQVQRTAFSCAVVYGARRLRQSLSMASRSAPAGRVSAQMGPGA